MTKLTSFVIDNQKLPVTLLHTEQVKEGVSCDIYSFVGDTSKDLAIIRVQPGFKTPLQRVIGGKQTIEGYISGSGRLMIQRDDLVYYEFEPNKENDPISVEIGDMMQWKATSDSVLTFYELCTPPYEKGRFEDLD